MTDFLKLSQEAYDSSTAYIDSNLRADWDYSIRAFRNEHAAGSKYLAEEYKARSRIFRPKTRSVIRKNEAAGAVALFSNMETVNVTPGDPDNPMSVAGAAALKEVLEYRLQKTIPTFQLVMGALQDAQTMGMVASYQYWDYQQVKDKKVKDQPCIDLIPLENLRLDAGASWIDPVGTSPYLCHILPMYVCDVKKMMASEDPKTGAPKWKKYEDDVLVRAKPEMIDSVRKARLGKQQDPKEENADIGSFDTVWVMRWFMRDDMGDDYTYYTLGTDQLLTDPKPIEEVYFHGKRPYVIGCSILETHKVFKSGVPVLTKPLQQETNDIANQRLDNVKFVLNKRWIVARGRQADVQSLVRNVPGGVTLTTDPNTDIKESNWPDVTSSSYVEQDRLNADYDELAGNFSPSTKVANNAVNDTLGGSKLAAQGAGMMTDYLLRTFIETWWEPVLRQMVLLEQYYETDDIVLGVCAKKARLFPRFGLSQITDDLLMQEVNVSVNVGMGSSDPAQRLQKLMFATQAIIGVSKSAPPNFNVGEFSKEVYSLAGYRDGERFMSSQVDPRILMMQQQMKQMQAAIEGKQMELQQKSQVAMLGYQSAEKIKAAELQVDGFRIQGDLRIREAEIAFEQQKLELEKIRVAVETNGQVEEQRLKLAQVGAKMEEAQLKLQQTREEVAAEREKIALELAGHEAVVTNESRVKDLADNVSKAVGGIASEIQAIKQGMNATASTMGDVPMLSQKVDALAMGMGQMMSKPDRKPKGFRFNKKDGKTVSVLVDYNDGQTEEMPVS